MVVTAALAAAVYAALWIGVVARWPWLVSGDNWVLRRFHAYGVSRPAWIGVWTTASDLFSPGVLRIAAGLGIAVAVLRGASGAAALLAVTVLPSGLLTAAAKALSGRPRPETALTHAASTSFPSGHALGIVVGVLAFGTLLWPRVRPSLRVPLVAFGGTLVFLVGLSRVVLNVHHPSDVVAGWALGLLYFLFCVAVVRPRVSAF